MDADAGPSVRTHEGLVAGAGRRGRARRPGLGHGQRRQHRRHHGQRPAAHGPHQGRGPPGHRHADPGASAAPRPCCSTPAPTPSAAPSGWSSSPRWARCTPATASASPTRGSACCRSARSPPRATRWSRRPTSCWPTRRWIGSTGATFVGNVEGRDLMTDAVDVVVTDGFTGNVALKTLEGGMRALVGGVLGAFEHRRRHPGRGRGAAAGPGPALRPARPREHGRRHAAGRRRGLHHQPRLVVGHRHRQRHRRGRTSWSWATWSSTSGPPPPRWPEPASRSAAGQAAVSLNGV